MIRSNKGNATILAVSICMAIIIIMCVIFEYIQMLIICTGVRDAVSSAVVSAVTANYDETYSQLREGYSGGYTFIDTEFTETMDTGDIYTRLDELLALTEENGVHSKYSAGRKEYSISNLLVQFKNTEFAQGHAKKNLNAIVLVDVKLPVRFGGREIFPLTFTLQAEATYMPKF